MSDSRRGDPMNLFASLWGYDSQEWNHDQRMMGAGIYELFLETTTITERDLVQRINSLADKNPKACGADGNDLAPSTSRVTELQQFHGLPGEPNDPPNPSVGPKSSMAVRQRVTRLKNRIARNIQGFSQGLQEPDTYQLNPEHLGTKCQQFGSLYDCLAEIHDRQQLLYTKFEEHEDVNLKARIRDEAKMWSVEAKGWSVATSTQDVEPLLAKIQHALGLLDHNPSVLEPAAMDGELAATRIRMFQIHLGENNLKASKGARLKKYGRAVDLIGPRAKVFRDLLSSQDRQFAIARMLTGLDNEDVKRSYQIFTERFADEWTKSEWCEGVCTEYEKGLIEQEKSVSDALKYEKQHKDATQMSRSHGRPHTADKPSRSSLSSTTGDQALQQHAQTRTITKSVIPPQAPPTYTDDLSDLSERQNDGMGVAAHERIRRLALSNTSFLESHRHPEESAKLAIRLDPAGARGKAISRHLTWSPNDTRGAFLNKVAELFPGKVIQRVNARLPQGAQAAVQATGPDGEWEMVREEWLKRLKQPLKKESSATVYLVEASD